MPETLPVLFSNCPPRATVVEVSARDGLQSEPFVLPPKARAQWLRRLFAAGVPEAEAGSFVDPKRLPQMADTARVVAERAEFRERIWVLVPNLRGLEAAVDASAPNIVGVVSCTETHSQANLGRAIREVLLDLERIAGRGAQEGFRMRASVSMVWADPTEGEVPPARVVEICRALRGMGFAEITLCDTSGGASPRDVAETLAAVLQVYPPDRVGLHLHETYGVVSANLLAGLLQGVGRFDASIQGFGGCPYAPGAPGNVDTAHLVQLLQAMKIETGIDLGALRSAAKECEAELNEAMYDEGTRLFPGTM